jgi:hypothetical protein
VLDVIGAAISGVRVVVNPDKLNWIGTDRERVV